MNQTWNRRGAPDEEQITASFQTDHLWNVADRYTLNTSVDFHGYYRESGIPGAPTSISRTGIVSLASSLRVFLEDSLDLVASIYGDHRASGQSQPDYDEHSWSWSYRLAFDYALDRLLY